MEYSKSLSVLERRGGHVETVHDVQALVMNGAGDIIDAWGDMMQSVCPRSSFKLIQALGLAEYQVTDRLDYLSLACASHNAEALHSETAAAWLNEMGLSEDDLQCGGHWPIDRDAEHDLVRAGHKYNALHNNCSGKHTGMLAFCQHQGWDLETYLEPDHPLQIWIRERLSEFSEINANDMPMVTDGCSAPNYFMPMLNVGKVFSRFISGCDMSDARAKACQLLMEAIAAYPKHIGGTNRFCTDIADISKGRLIGKAGALGSYILLAPKDDKIIYVKVGDGLGPAAPPAICHLLKKYGIWEEAWDAPLQKYHQPVIKNCREIETGDMIVVMPA